ncbi:DUF2927 domain-containing protein [uncultured Jannaschia sp.]|uniref:DUF2927 domain-containing protein n=1 Tax=uncultured Jannaschia sp. TaxID=293347 RepID=UPI0026285B68|nr:DUF2927 domain-containing protein [uncultured Jannaschia sp.]
MRAAFLLPVALTLAACQPMSPEPVEPSPIPKTRPARPPAPSGAVSAESRDARAFYANLQGRLLSQGLLKRDGGPDAETFDAAQLARNFERIALFSEYAETETGFVPRQSRAQLRRWEGPVRVELHFGPSVPEATRRTDRVRVQSYLERLARLTDHPIDLVETGGNFHVFVASVDEQRALGPAIAAAEPGLARTTIREIARLDWTTYCAVYASSASERPNAYVSAIAFVRSEHPDLFRQSCYHEEIAQGLGLANDSFDVNPSIFNDDEEYALLTRQDELLLRMLYDPRLEVGMAAEEARPLIRRIAAELRPEDAPV